MKKWLSCILSAVLMVCLLAGCGGGGGDTQTPEKKEGIVSGYWVVEKMVMEGNEFAKEDMEGIFGPADGILVLAFSESGAINGVYFGEPLKGSYTGTEDALELDLAGEKGTGVCKDGVLEIKIGEDMAFTLKNQEEMPDSIGSNPWATYDPDFSAEETAAMSNFMAYGRYYIEDDVIYGLTHKESSNGGLGAIPFHMKGDFPEFEEIKVLDGSGSANYLCKDGDYLYYTMNYESICRIKLDGSDQKTLYKGACDYLQIHDGRLYFADESYNFVSTDMEGKDLKTVVDKEIYYPYFICADWMIFQDDADDESLHLFNIADGTEVNITYIPSYNPILDGKYLYYTDIVEGVYYLNRIDMSDPDTFRCESSELTLCDSAFMIDDLYVYTTNSNSVAKEDWKKLTDEETSITAVQAYVSKDYEIHHDLDSQGLISGKYLMSKEKHGGTSFS